MLPSRIGVVGAFLIWLPIGLDGISFLFVIRYQIGQQNQLDGISVLRSRFRNQRHKFLYAGHGRIVLFVFYPGYHLRHLCTYGFSTSDVR